MKNLARLLFVVVSILLLVAASPGKPVRASASTDAEFVGFLEEAWVNAIVTKNIDVLNRVIADDFNGVSPGGDPYTKQEAIADVRSGFYTVESMQLTNLKVRVFDNIAIATYYQTEKSKLGDDNSSGRYFFTDVWINRNDDWQAISSQGTPITLP